MSEPAGGVRVLFEDDDLVIVAKPSGVPTEPEPSGATSLRDQVAAWLRERRGARADAPHAVSRLDTGVSGVVTFAVSARGKKAMARAREQGTFERRYVALARGRLDGPGSIAAPIQGQAAETAYRPIAATAPGPVTLVLFRPRTGRTHQLRIHAAALGAPLLGDPRYGGPRAVATASGRVHACDRPMLHAAALRVELPRRGPLWVTDPIPEAMLGIWSALDGDPEAWNEVGRACVAGWEQA